MISSLPAGAFALNKSPKQVAIPASGLVVFEARNAPGFVGELRDRYAKFHLAIAGRARWESGRRLRDWIDAILDQRAPSAPFACGAALTERVLLGTLVPRTGQSIKWRPDAMQAEGNPAANALLRPRVRPEWESLYVQS